MQNTSNQNVFGLAHLWASGDAISHSVAIILGLMSVAVWCLIVAKILEGARMRRASRAVADFWAARSVGEGIRLLQEDSGTNPFAALATQAESCGREFEAAGSKLSSHFDPVDQMERALRQKLSGCQAGMESGLTFLATAGATAPFVGLFGTVWGIYHALVAIGVSGQAALEKVAGPVGESLIMTAAGLAVALPAVFAYNAFNRVNRVILADLDAFASDLHAFFTLGKAFSTTARIHPLNGAPFVKAA